MNCQLKQASTDGIIWNLKITMQFRQNTQLSLAYSGQQITHRLTSFLSRMFARLWSLALCLIWIVREAVCSFAWLGLNRRQVLSGIFQQGHELTWGQHSAGYRAPSLFGDLRLYTWRTSCFLHCVYSAIGRRHRNTFLTEVTWLPLLGVCLRLPYFICLSFHLFVYLLRRYELSGYETS